MAVSPEAFLRSRIDELLSAFPPRSSNGYNKLARELLEFQLAVLDWHKQMPVRLERPAKFIQESEVFTDSFKMAVTQQYEFVLQEEYYARFGTWPITTPLIAKMLEPHRDHPDFNPEWL